METYWIIGEIEKGEHTFSKELISNLPEILMERSERILKRFGEVAISGLSDPRLLKILENVAQYWRDSFRPSLTSLSCEAVGGDPEAAEDAGLMFTLASSGFGIHDDILDRSAAKHLRMTILGLYGINSALLVGDLLIVKAWTTVHKMMCKCNASRMAEIIEAYGNLSVEICEAEFMESQSRRELDIDIEYYKNVLWKAMAEIEACTRIGAILGNGSNTQVEALGEVGRRLGFMSRLADDVEDCLNLKGDLLHRLKYESIPYPLLYASQVSRENHLQVKEILKKSEVTPSDIKTLLNLCFETNAFEHLRKIVEENEKKADEKLFLLKPTRAREILSALNKASYERVADLCI